MAFPGAGTAQGFVDAWRAYRPQATPQYFGWGYGADLGGLATQGAPAPPGSPNGVTYPFRSLDGRMTIDRQRTGERVFDYSQEGVAHYGLYAEWYEEVRKTGGSQLAEDMLRGPEAYLQMWERSVGIPPSRCMSATRRLGRRGLGPLRLGLTTRELLERAGQPLTRNRAWSWCASGKRVSSGAAQTAVMTKKARVGLVASTARGQRARGIGPGASAKRLRGKAKRVGKRLWTARLRKRKVAYVVRRRKVHTVAVAVRKVARSKASLRRYLRLIPRDGVTPRPPTVDSPASTRIAPRKAVPLAEQRGAPQFPLVCGL
jgi:hypothetical protein